MAPISSKRTKDYAAQTSRKRQRVDIRSAGIRKKNHLNSLPPDSLSWKEAALTDRLEDAEGFFGLEEIDDVEVLRNASSGTIEFRVGKAHCES